MKRFVYVWFRYLETDGLKRRDILLQDKPCVLIKHDHARTVITACDPLAQSLGIYPGMALTDARVLEPKVIVKDADPLLSAKWLKKLAEFCIRYSPIVSVDKPDGIIINATGCAHLWGGEASYLSQITKTFKNAGYHVLVAIADTIGAAWAIVHYDKEKRIAECGQTANAILALPVEALRIESCLVDRLHTLGLKKILNLINIPRPALQRRFGNNIIDRLDQALGKTEEFMEPVYPVPVYEERLPSLEPIITSTGIEIALKRILASLCDRLRKEQNGLRVALFKCFRVDGQSIVTRIGTIRPSFNMQHLLKLFESKLSTIAPGPGIEVFVLEAQQVEPVSSQQQKMWQSTPGLNNIHLAELIDRIAQRSGEACIRRYLPAPHHWPERSYKKASSIDEEPTTEWNKTRPRPIQLLSKPEQVQVTAPIPDYPPMNFRYKGILHTVVKADGPERIEQEWWLQQGQHRDYYYVEDEEGKRYWLFRSGHYGEENFKWYVHGFFA